MAAKEELAKEAPKSRADVEVQEFSAAELLAVVGYMTDVTPTGSLHHAWRVALLGEYLASTLCPQAQRDVFYAGLLHDIGSVGAYKHISRYISMREQNDDVQIKTHPQRGSALVNWLPGLASAAAFVRSHHEWWDGSGYPDGLQADLTPLGAQIIAAASAVDIAGCFRSRGSLRDSLTLLSALTGRAWSCDIWSALVRSAANSEFYDALIEPSQLPDMIAAKVQQLPLPLELEGQEGVERVLHLIAALVDLKDPSTSGHSLRTARRARRLTKYMGLPDEQVNLAYRAGLVHDCGRLGVETCILNKSGRLNEQQMEVVRKHAQMTIRSLSCLPNCPGLTALGEIAGHDHERYDGKGYPDGLSGEEIPLISRILSVVDAFDSMIAAAHYRLLTPKGAVVRIEQAAGSQFDPKIAKAVVEAIGGELEDFQAAA
jgi:HD-GYP domain-containing protein (c-di-GMP phosphodiesterase class II)